MAIYEQSALGSMLEGLPSGLADMVNARQQKQMTQQQMMMNMQQMQQQQMQMDLQKKQMGMDRGGYGNQMLSEYFNALMMAPGTLASDTHGNFQWTMSPELVMPTKQDAWAKYQQIVGPSNITSADSDYFMGTLWPNLVKERAGLVVSEIQKLEKAGYGPDDMRVIMANNPQLFSDLNTTMPFIQNNAPEISAKMAAYMPQKPVNPMERMSDYAPYMGTAAVGGSYAYGKMQETSQKFIDEATKKYEGKLERRGVSPENNSTKRLNKLKTDLKKLEKSNPRTEKGWKARTTKIDNVKTKITGENTKINRIVNKAKSIKNVDIAKNSRWNRMMKHMPKNRMLNMPVAAFAPTVLGGAGDIIGGPKGEAIGSGLGGGVQVTYGAAKGMSLAKWLMKRVPGIAARKATQAGTMAMMDSPALPFGDILGAAWGLGSGSYEVYNAIQEWRAANQSY